MNTQRKSTTRTTFPAILAVLCLVFAPGAQAATATKAATGTDLTGATAGVWSGGSGANGSPASADVATWTSSSLGAGLTLATSNSWGGISVAGALTDISITGAGTLTNGSGGIALTNNNMTLGMGAVALGASQTWSVNSGETLTVANAISGGYSLTKTGSGSLTLSGHTGTFTGGTAISAGTVNFNAYDCVKGTTTVNGGVANVANYDGLRSSDVIVNVNGGLTATGGYPELGSLAGAGNITNTWSGGFGSFTLGYLNDSATYSGVLSGTGTLTKTGTGTQTLSGVNPYSGATTISGGKLVGVVGGSCASSVVTVGNTAGCILGISITNNTMGWTNAGLTFAGSSAGLDFNFGYATPPSTTVAPLKVNGNVTFTGTPTVTIEAGTLPAGTGTYPLMAWTGTANPANSPTTVTLPPHVAGNLSLNGAGNILNLNITQNNQEPLSWNAGTATWDLNTTANWTDATGAAGQYYLQTTLPGDEVVFNDSGLGGTVTLNTTVTPASVTVNNTNYNYTISGSGAIAGATGVTKSGTGNLTLSTVNAYTGNTTIGGGTLQINSVNSLGAGPGSYTANAITISNGATLKVTGSVYFETAPNGNQGITLGAGGGVIEVDSGNLFVLDTLPSSYQITGVGGLTLTGGGVFEIRTPGNTYQGNTVIAAGTLVYRYVNNIMPNGPGCGNVTVSTGAILNMDGQSDTINGLSGGGSVDNTNYTTYSGNNSSLTIGNNNATSEFDGVIENTGTNTLAIAKIGSGTLTLTGANTYGGGTTLGAGTLQIGNAGTSGTLGSGTVTATNNGTTLAFNRTDVVASPFVVTNRITKSSSFTPNIVVNSGAVQLGGSADNSSATADVKSGATLMLAKASTSSIHSLGGNSTVESGGTLQLAGSGGDQIYNQVTVTVNSGGVFDLNSLAESFTTLNLAGTGISGGGGLINSTTTATASLNLTNSISLTANSSIGGNGNISLPNAISGSGFGLTKVGAGTLTLSGANTYTGDTTVSGGTLEIVQPAIAPNSTVWVASGAVLQLDFSVTNAVTNLVLNGISVAGGIHNQSTDPTFITGLGSLLVPSTIATNPTNLTFSVSGNTLNLSWPADHLGWLVQSNAVNLAVPNDWQDLSNTATGTSYSITIDPTQANVFYRLREP